MNNIWQGHRIRLRAVESSDWEAHFQWQKDTDTARAVHEIPFPNSSESVRRWAEQNASAGAEGHAFRFQIETLAGELAGTFNTHSCDARNGTFAYGLGIMEQHQRKGFASEAIGLVLNYFFNELRYQKVVAYVYDFNTASIALHEHLGFQLEGRLRRMIYTGGQHHDLLIFGMTAEEFAEARFHPRREDPG